MLKTQFCIALKTCYTLHECLGQSFHVFMILAVITSLAECIDEWPTVGPGQGAQKLYSPELGPCLAQQLVLLKSSSTFDIYILVKFLKN